MKKIGERALVRPPLVCQKEKFKTLGLGVSTSCHRRLSSFHRT